MDSLVALALEPFLPLYFTLQEMGLLKQMKMHEKSSKAYQFLQSNLKGWISLQFFLLPYKVLKTPV